MSQIKELVQEIGDNAVAHGWWEEERNFGELIALCHSELSEALEEYRKAKDPRDTYYKCTNTPDALILCPLEILKTCMGCPFAKPEGIPSELADVVIRVFDMCNHYGIDIEQIIYEKHNFNKTRPYKHGKIM